MEKDIIDIVKEKEFIQLSVEERLELKELCSNEDEFNQMKSVLINVEGINYVNESPRSETKKSLDHLFDQAHPKAAPIWYNSVLAVVIPKEKPFYRQPLVQLAAVALILFMVIPFYQTDLNNNQVRVAQNTELEQDVVDEMKPVESSVDETVLDGNNAQNETPIELNEEVADMIASTLITSEPVGSSESFAIPSDHPDGIFSGGSNVAEATFSLPASESSDLLDLLTSTF